MIALFCEKEEKSKPPERESGSSSDGDPGRSTPVRNACWGRSALVSDDTQEYEDEQTGISLVCKPTMKELRVCLRKAGFLRNAHRADFIIALFPAAYAVDNFVRLIRNGGSTVSWIIGFSLFLVPVLLLLLPFADFRYAAKKYRRSVADSLEIYPDHLELKKSGKELPLDGTGELLCTQEAYTLVFPPENEANDRSLRFLIVPLRCVDADVLPYVEAMLVAGTRPRRTN